MQGLLPAYEQAHMGLDFLPPPAIIKYRGNLCNKETGFKWPGWFRNAKRHRQDTKNLVELISKIRGMYIHIK